MPLAEAPYGAEHFLSRFVSHFLKCSASGGA
jgi:hypothetical protein